MLDIKLKSGELYVVELWCQLTPPINPTSQGDGIIANSGIV